MGVTYRYMGTSHSLGVDKGAPIFLLYLFIRLILIFYQLKPMRRWDITANKQDEEVIDFFNRIIYANYCCKCRAMLCIRFL